MSIAVRVANPIRAARGSNDFTIAGTNRPLNAQTARVGLVLKCGLTDLSMVGRVDETGREMSHVKRWTTVQDM